MAANPNDTTKPAKAKAKKKKEKVTATLEMRHMAAAVAKARTSASQWKSYESEARERLFDLTDNQTNIEIVTESGDVVATITESDPRQSMDWNAFRADHPDLDYDKYLKEGTTTVTLRTSWVESTPG